MKVHFKPFRVCTIFRTIIPYQLMLCGDYRSLLYRVCPSARFTVLCIHWRWIYFLLIRICNLLYSSSLADCHHSAEVFVIFVADDPMRFKRELPATPGAGSSSLASLPAAASSTSATNLRQSVEPVVGRKYVASTSRLNESITRWHWSATMMWPAPLGLFAPRLPV